MLHRQKVSCLCPLPLRPLCSFWYHWSQHTAHSSIILVRHSGLCFWLV